MHGRVAEPLGPDPSPMPSLTPPCCPAVSGDDSNLLNSPEGESSHPRTGLVVARVLLPASLASSVGHSTPSTPDGADKAGVALPIAKACGPCLTCALAPNEAGDGAPIACASC